MSDDWQLLIDKVVLRTEHILKNSLWTDCSFEVGIENSKKIFKAHKLILSMASPVFEKMFLYDGMEETNKNVAEIVDIQPDAFSALLTYIYTDRVEMSSFDQACELCYVAKKYMMPALVKRCSSYIWKDVNISNVCRCYEFAKLFDQNSLIERCKEIICAQTQQLIETESFIDIEKNTLLMILDEDKLNIQSELVLFNAAEKWIKAEFERRDIKEEEKKRTLYDELLGKIRFLTMSPKEFAEGPATSEVIPKDKVLALLLMITSPNCSQSVPAGFSSNVCKRAAPTHMGSNILPWELDHAKEIEIKEAKTISSFSLVSSKDLQLLGVQVHGHLLTDESDDMHGDSIPPISFDVPGTDEGLIPFVENNEADHFQHTITKSPNGTYKETINVYFKNPVDIKASKEYKMGVRIADPGWYVGGDLNCSNLVFKEYNFQFKRDKDQAQNPCFIDGLIF